MGNPEKRCATPGIASLRPLRRDGTGQGNAVFYSARSGLRSTFTRVAAGRGVVEMWKTGDGKVSSRVYAVEAQ